MLFLAARAEAGTAFVPSQNAGKVTVLDTETLSVVAVTEVPGDPVAVAVDPATGEALVIAVASRRLHVISPGGEAVRDFPLPGAPFGIAAGGSGLSYVTDWQGKIHEIDSADGRVVRSFPAGANPSGVAVEGTLLAVTDRDDDRLRLIDLATGEAAMVAVGHHPFGVTLHEGRAYVADVLSDSVSVVDLGERRKIGEVKVGERPYAVAFAGGLGFVTDQYGGTVTAFDPATLTPRATITVGEYPEGIAALPDGTGVLVANWLSDTLSRIDATTLAVTEEVALPSGPRAFGAFIAP